MIRFRLLLFCRGTISPGLFDWCECAGSDLTGAILDETDMPGAKATEEQLQTVVSGKSVKREA
ncbi:MAG TPA: hypothetical protein VF043_04120 [Ktedonobacteraceae bacterium]